MSSPPSDLQADEDVLRARRHAWLTLSLTAGLGPITLRRAVDSAFGVLGCLNLSHSGWGEVEGIGSHRASQILRDLPRAMKEADQVLARCETLSISILTPDHQDFPALFKDLPDAPSVLYVRGALQPRDVHSVAMVGSRNCSFYGRDQASRLASLLAGGGVTVVSGGARGVDSAAHEGALRSPEGRTIAVLGCGVDVVYPPENADLFARIIHRGAVVSHYPPGTAPNQRHFPERNRVISALSRGVLVIEADLRSGSLITARVAADDHNRPVLALPGRVDNPLSAGPHQLIQQGAALVTNLEEILAALGPLPQSAHAPGRHQPPAELLPTTGPQAPLPFTAPAPPRQADTTLSADQQKILAALREHHEAPPDVLIDATGLPAQAVLKELTLLTLKGKVRRVDAQTYALPK
jgi:DNA processing protein